MTKRKPVALQMLNKLLLDAFENNTETEVIAEHVDIPQFINSLPQPKKRKQLNIQELEELITTQTSPLLHDVMSEPLVNIFDIISPIRENYKLLYNYGLHPDKYIPTIEDLTRIQQTFTKLRCPEILNHSWLVKFVINLIHLITKNNRLPLWITQHNKCLLTLLFNKLIRENEIEIERANVKIIIRHIYSNYITQEQLLILNNISVHE
jgi:hypothetical protein